jgi:hypothetical protein
MQFKRLGLSISLHRVSAFRSLSVAFAFVFFFAGVTKVKLTSCSPDFYFLVLSFLLSDLPFLQV